MTDFDFDEIDKAVTGAMTGETPAPKPAAEPVEVETPAPEPADVPEDLPAIIQKPLPPAVRRTTGRVMDIMPRGAGSAKPAPRPTADSYHAPTAVSRNKDLLGSLLDEPAAEAATPFLPDANTKVEKRPLGQPSDASIVIESPVQDSEAVPLAEEVNSDLLDIEAKVDVPETPPVAGDTPEEPVLEVNEVTEIESAPVPEVAPSIVQQYQEKQTAAAEPGAIYDTEAYHTPIKPPVKRKTVLWIILWFVGLIVVGAGVGFAVYTFVLPAL